MNIFIDLFVNIFIENQTFKYYYEYLKLFKLIENSFGSR